MARFIHAFIESPRSGEVYNLGGGRENSVSVMEAVARLEGLTGRKLRTEYVDTARVGDHICYISDMTKLKADYPGWSLERSLDDIFKELAGVV